MITGSTTTGYGSHTQFVGRLIRGFVELHACIQEPMAMGMLPVDYVARSIILLTRFRAVSGKVFHVANAQPVLFLQLGRACVAAGYTVTPMPYAEWRAKLMTAAFDIPALAPLLPFFSAECDLSVQRYDCKEFVSALEALDLPAAVTAAPDMDDSLLLKYVQQQFIAE
jgi:thioester reductase-like protein